MASLPTFLEVRAAAQALTRTGLSESLHAWVAATDEGLLASRPEARQRVLDWYDDNAGLEPHETDPLDLHGLLLSSLPDAICLMTNLRALDASGNSLTGMPDGFIALHNLDWLNLDFNPELAALPRAVMDRLDACDVSARGCALSPRTMESLRIARFRRRHGPVPRLAVEPAQAPRSRSRSRERDADIHA